LLVNKPAGMTVHPGAGTKDDTLANALIHYCPKTLSDINGDERPGIVHRLDKHTSGLMIVAKNNQAHLHLSEQLQTRTLTRIYAAVIWGILNPDNGTIELNIMRDIHNRKLMTTSITGGKTAITHYETEEVFLKGMLSLITCKLETGRTHQIRVHMESKNHGIFGDPEYGGHKQRLQKYFNIEDNMICNFKRQALYAKELKFIHPKTNEEMHFTSELPEDFQQLIRELSA
jgi:23S rRNA pseudouridine1911/1915/1917 synthase